MGTSLKKKSQGPGNALARPLGALHVTQPDPRFLTLLRPIPPNVCPWCQNLATGHVRDERGLWTWACLGGCNP